MNIPSNINANTIEALETLKNSGTTNSQQELFLSIMMNNKTPDTNNPFLQIFTKENIFNKAIFATFEDGNTEGLKTLSLIANLNGIQMLLGGSNQNNFDMLYDNYIQKEMINDIEEKLENLKSNISKTEDKKLLLACKEEYKIYSKVLEKYKEFQAEDEKILSQMIQLRKRSTLF